MARVLAAIVLGLIVSMLPGGAADEVGAKSSVTFLLTPYAPVVSSIKNLSFQLVQSWDQKGKLMVVHSAEWEIRKEGNMRVARVLAQEYFYDNEGTHDARPPHPEGSRGDFNKDDLREIGNLKPGNYRMALLINGSRASNVIAFAIDPAFDLAKAPVLTVGMDEAPPGVEFGSLVAWVVGPTREDPRFTNYEVAFADIWVDGVVLKQELRAWQGIVGPCREGMPDVRTYNTPFRLKGVDLQKRHEFRLQVGKYVSDTLRLDLSSGVMGIEWDRGKE